MINVLKLSKKKNEFIETRILRLGLLWLFTKLQSDQPGYSI